MIRSRSAPLLALAERINPSAFARYLRCTGWNPFETKKERVRVFQREDGRGSFQVVLPFDKSLSDFQEATYRAVETLAEAEGRSLEQVFLYLLNPSADVLKIRIEKRGIEAGSILFNDTMRIYENARDLVGAATLDVLHPRRYHRGRMDKTVMNFLADCRFGQTEIGSYVISVICPFAELDERGDYRQLSIFSDEDRCAVSLTRQITNKVMASIASIKRHIDDGEMGKLVSDDTGTISANFYEALTGLSLEEDDVRVDFMAEWSPVVGKTSAVEDRLFLTHDYCQPIKEAIGKLKGEPLGSTEIIGRIKKLESSPDINMRTTGKITVVYLDENSRPKTVSAVLSRNDYNQAMQAHEGGRYVELIGRVTGKNPPNMECETFRVIE